MKLESSEGGLRKEMGLWQAYGESHVVGVYVVLSDNMPFLSW